MSWKGAALVRTVELLIIGGGPAGLSAAIGAKREGIEDILVVERNDKLGGILNQCIHNGFGVQIFGEELTGPEYAHRLIKEVKALGITCLTKTTVLKLDHEKQVTIVSENALEIIQAKAVILAMGCRERPRGAISIPGSRPAGIFSAGTAQELVNMRGYKLGKSAVIVGSGDIGLIMARRLTLEGMDVKCVLEIMPYSGGLARNITQCLDDFNIPLLYNHSVSEIIGKDRISGIKAVKVDENKQPIADTEKYIACDTLLFSVGLIPENELSKQAGVIIDHTTGGAEVDNYMQTNIDGIFACGNVLHVHDLVDNVTLEAYEAAKGVRTYLDNGKQDETLSVDIINGIKYIVPQRINRNSKKLVLKFRSDNIYKGIAVNVCIDDKKILSHRKKIITPGEMETITLYDFGDELLNAKNISIGLG